MKTMGKVRFNQFLDLCKQQDKALIRCGVIGNTTVDFVKKYKIAHYRYNWKLGKAERVE